MAQVRKLLEGGRPTRKAPKLINVGGLDFVEEDFMKTLNKESNLDTFIYNHNLSSQLANDFKEAIHNLNSILKDHPGYLLATLYVTDLVQSPATKVFEPTFKKKRNEGEMYIKPLVDSLYGGDLEAWENDWYSRGNDTTRATKLGKFLQDLSLDDAKLEEMFDEFDFTNSKFKTVEEYKLALFNFGLLLEAGLNDDGVYDIGHTLGIDLLKWLHGNSLPSSENLELNPRTKEEIWAEQEKTIRQLLAHEGYSEEEINLAVQVQKDLWESSRQNDLQKIQFLGSLNFWARVYGKPYEEWLRTKASSFKLERDAGTDSPEWDKYWSDIIGDENTIWEYDTEDPNWFKRYKRMSFTEYAKTQFEFFRKELASGKQLDPKEYSLWKMLVSNSPYDYIPLGIVESSPYIIWVYNKASGKVETHSIFDELLKDEPIVQRAIDKIYSYTFENKISIEKFAEFFRLYDQMVKLNPDFTIELFITADLSSFLLSPALLQSGETVQATQQSAQLEQAQVPLNKKGGIINKLLQGGAIESALYDSWKAVDDAVEQRNRQKEETAKAAAEAQGITVELYKKRNEYWNSEDFSFSTEDYLHMGAVAADIIALGSSVAIGGGSLVAAISGLGSWLLDTVGDLSEAIDDKISWSDFGENFVTNGVLGVLGILPGGKAASLTGKIVKYGPRIVAFLNAAGAAPSIIGSVKKAMDGEDLTRQDWTNLMDGMRIVLTGTRDYATVRKSKKFLVSDNSGSVSIETKNGNTFVLKGKQMDEYLSKKTAKEKNDYLRKIKPDEFLEGDAIKQPFVSKIPWFFNNKTKETVNKSGKRYMTAEEVYEKYGGIPKSYKFVMDRVKWINGYLSPWNTTTNNHLLSNALVQKHFPGVADKAALASALRAASEVNAKVAARESVSLTLPALAALAQPTLTVLAAPLASPSAPASAAPLPTALTPTLPASKTPIQVNNKILTYLQDAEKSITYEGQKYLTKKNKKGNRYFQNSETGGIVRDKNKIRELNKLRIIQSTKSPTELRNKSNINIILFDDNVLFISPYKLGGKLHKYLNVALFKIGGTSPDPTDNPFKWWFDINGWGDYTMDSEFKNSSGKSNATSVQNRQLQFPDGMYTNGVTTKSYTLLDAYNEWDKYNKSQNLFKDVKTAWKTYIDTYPKGNKEGFIKWYNDEIDYLRSHNYVDRIEKPYGSTGYLEWNNRFHTLYNSYTTGYDAAQNDILGGATWRRVVNAFSDDNSYSNYRQGLLDENDSNSNVWIGNDGKLHDGLLENYTGSTSEGAENGTVTTPSESSLASDNLSSFDIKGIEGRILDVISRTEKDPNIKKNFDISPLLEFSKFLRTISLNNNIYKEYLKTPVVLETPNRVTANQLDTARIKYNYLAINDLLMDKALKLAATSGIGPEGLLAILNSAYLKVIANNLEEETAIYKTIAANQNEARAAADANYNKNIDTANTNNSRIGAWLTQRILAKAARDIYNKQAGDNLTNYIKERFEEYSDLHNRATAYKYRDDLYVMYGNARRALAEEYVNHRNTIRNRWFSNPENANKTEDDFDKFYNKLYGYYWQTLNENLYLTVKRLYDRGMEFSSNNPWLATVGINSHPEVSKEDSTPNNPYTSGNFSNGVSVKKKGGLLTYSELLALLQNEQMFKKDLLKRRENNRRNMLSDKNDARLIAMNSSFVAKLINKALGI